MSKTWFTSDQHFFHHNIIEYEGRPFKNVGEMNKEIIDRYRECVSDDDTVYFLGDLTMINQYDKVAKVVRQLPGHKQLILGNHDAFKPFAYHTMGFEGVHTTYPITMPITMEYEKILQDLDVSFNLVHDPAAARAQVGGFWIVGHVHNLFDVLETADGFVVNVSVERWNYCPVSEDTIKNIYREWFQSVLDRPQSTEEEGE